MAGGQVDILVATPLLAGAALVAGRLDLGAARHCVLDEGDRLLDEQFVQQVDAVLAACTSPHLVRPLLPVSALPPPCPDDQCRHS